MDLISKDIKSYRLIMTSSSCTPTVRKTIGSSSFRATSEELMALPHPWVVVEDCHVNSYNITNHLSKYMEVGDYYVIEDLSPQVIAVYVDPLDPESRNYKGWGLAKRKEVFEWFMKHPDVFKVDTYYADYFGYNGSTNWDGFLRKMK